MNTKKEEEGYTAATMERVFQTLSAKNYRFWLNTGDGISFVVPAEEKRKYIEIRLLKELADTPPYTPFVYLHFGKVFFSFPSSDVLQESFLAATFSSPANVTLFEDYETTSRECYKGPITVCVVNYQPVNPAVAIYITIVQGF